MTPDEVEQQEERRERRENRYKYAYGQAYRADKALRVRLCDSFRENFTEDKHDKRRRDS